MTYEPEHLAILRMLAREQIDKRDRSTEKAIESMRAALDEEKEQLLRLKEVAQTLGQEAQQLQQAD